MNKSVYPSHGPRDSRQAPPVSSGSSRYDGVIQLQRMIGNHAVNRLFGGLRPDAPRIARKPAGVNMALRGRVADM